MKQTIMAVALGFLLGCGGSPTTPTRTSTTQSTQSVAGTTDPAPAPVPPTQPPVPPSPPGPTPTPPAPTPTPAPTPASVVLHATVETFHWYPGATFTLPSQFDMVIVGDTVKIATLDPLHFSYFGSNTDFIVKPQDFEVVVQGSRFTFNGLAGQASGTVTLAK